MKLRDQVARSVGLPAGIESNHFILPGRSSSLLYKVATLTSVLPATLSGHQWEAGA